MDFLDNVKKAVAETAQTVARKTGEIVETSKTKYSLYDSKNEIEKLYAEIGEAVYKSYKEDSNASEIIEAKCAEIDNIAEKMEELRQKLND